MTNNKYNKRKDLKDIRSALIYDSKIWSVKKSQRKKLDVAETGRMGAVDDTFCNKVYAVYQGLKPIELIDFYLNILKQIRLFLKSF